MILAAIVVGFVAVYVVCSLVAGVIAAYVTRGTYDE